MCATRKQKFHKQVKCQTNIYKKDDKNCQATTCYKKIIQCVLTRTLKKPQMFICGQWSQQKNQIICGQWPDPVIRSQLNQQVTRTVKLSDGIRKTIQCLMTRSVNLMSVLTQSNVCSDKNCQQTQSINMRPVKPSMNMQLTKQAVPYQYTRLCNDKNCQSARCYKKSDYTKWHKTCQSTQYMQPKKPISNTLYSI